MIGNYNIKIKLYESEPAILKVVVAAEEVKEA